MTGWSSFLFVILCTGVLVTAYKDFPTLQSEKDYDACRESVREQADLCRREAIVSVIYDVALCASGSFLSGKEKCIERFRDAWGSPSDCDKSSYDICASQREQMKKDQQEQRRVWHAENYGWFWDILASS